MIKIVDFDEREFSGFAYDGIESELSGEDVSDIVRFYSLMGSAYVAIIDGKIEAIGGVHPLWSGWGSAWLFLNKKAKRYKLSIFKRIMSNIQNDIKKYGIKTLSVQCVDEYEDSKKLLGHLGFCKIKDVKMSLYGRSQ